MKSTGIVRRVDDIGRIIIPKAIRNALDIREGDPLEIFVDFKEKTLSLKLYQPYFEPWCLLEDVAETMRDSEEFHEFATDVDTLARKIKKSAQR